MGETAYLLVDAGILACEQHRRLPMGYDRAMVLGRRQMRFGFLQNLAAEADIVLMRLRERERFENLVMVDEFVCMKRCRIVSMDRHAIAFPLELDASLHSMHSPGQTGKSFGSPRSTTVR